MRAGRPVGGDSDIAAVGALVADRSRCRILLALGDGRALPASRLATEAGVAPATTSSHLAKLTQAGLLAVEARGRHRYYRLAGPHVGALLETLQQLAPAVPISSLREHTAARALRAARTCYDHLAGELGVSIMRSLLDHGFLAGGDGVHDPARDPTDPRAGWGHDLDYVLTDAGHDHLTGLGVRLDGTGAAVRYCVDWTEQRHHLSGPVGRALFDRVRELGWVESARGNRAVRVTEAGRHGFAEAFELVSAPQRTA